MDTSADPKPKLRVHNWKYGGEFVDGKVFVNDDDPNIATPTNRDTFTNLFSYNTVAHPANTSAGGMRIDVTAVRERYVQPLDHAVVESWYAGLHTIGKTKKCRDANRLD